jgi:uncharacterized membrane protein
MSPGLLITGVVFIVAGILHFVTPKFYLAIMPSYMPQPLLMWWVWRMAHQSRDLGP